MHTPIIHGHDVKELQGLSTLVAIGNFDGVHLGHREVLASTAKQAAVRGLVPVVLTFEPHPTVAVGRPSPALLTPVERKVELIERIDSELRVVVQNFDAQFAAQTPEAFVRNVLIDTLHARCVCVGDNFRFGANRAGSLDTLMHYGMQHGFVAQAAPLVGDEHGRYSSTRVRSAIAGGELDEARRVLGRPHSLAGQVVEGQRRARTLGYPTANLAWVREALPPHGVYCVAVDRVDADGRGRRLGTGVCNIGVRPTVDAGFAVEVHVFDCDQELYGSVLRVHLLSYLRPERKFAGIDELRAQIEQDAARARQILGGLTPSADAGDAWF